MLHGVGAQLPLVLSSVAVPLTSLLTFGSVIWFRFFIKQEFPCSLPIPPHFSSHLMGFPDAGTVEMAAGLSHDHRLQPHA